MKTIFEVSMEYSKMITKFIFDNISLVGEKYNLSRMEAHALLFFFIREGNAKTSDFIQCGSYSKSNVSKSLDKLQKLDYLQLKTLETDRRFQIVELSEKGMLVGKEIKGKILPIMVKLTQGISDEEKEFVKKIGAKLKDNIDSILNEN